MFKNKKLGLLLIVALLVVPMVLVACGDDDSDDDKGGDVKLNQEIENAGLKVMYPEGWSAKVDEEDGSIMIANKDSVLDQVGEEGAKPADDEFGAIVMAAPLADLGGIGGREAFAMMAGFMASEGAGEAEVKDLKIGDKDAFRADVTPEDGTDGFIVGFESNGALVLVVGVSAEGKIGDFEDTTLKIAETVEYSAP